MKLPKFLMADNSEFPEDLFVDTYRISKIYPKCRGGRSRMAR